jgi:GDPmannose 4,6-dehydratase
LRAFITGVTGQDGWYLAEFLRGRGYEVFGLARRLSFNRQLPDCEIVNGDITDASAVAKIIAEIRPDEIYNLAAQSHVGESFKSPGTTWAVNAQGCFNVLEAARQVGAKFYQASTSELFGTEPSPQSEETRFHPRSPYGVAKLAAYWQTVNYREAYGLHASNGILFNHESPRRGHDFVTQKVCQHVASVLNGNKGKLVLGNLEARRDWGHAEDYVRAMWLMLQQDEPGDYVVATGESHSVRELCQLAYGYAQLDWRDWVESSCSEFRPAEVPDLRGNPAKIEALGWKRKYAFRDLIEEMVDSAVFTASRSGFAKAA